MTLSSRCLIRGLVGWRSQVLTISCSPLSDHSQTTISHPCSFLWYLTPGTLRFPGYGDPLIRPPFHCLHPYVFYCSSLDSQIYDCNHSLALHASVLNPALLLHAAPVNWMWLAEKFTTALMCLIQIHDLNAVWQSQHMSSSCHSLILQTTISYLSLPRILLPLTSSPLSLELNLAFSFTEYTEAMWREFHRFRHHFYPPNSIYTLILCLPAGSHSDLVMFLLKADFSSSTWALDSICSHLFKDIPPVILLSLSYIINFCLLLNCSHQQAHLFFSHFKNLFWNHFLHHPSSHFFGAKLQSHIYLLFSLSPFWIFS